MIATVTDREAMSRAPPLPWIGWGRVGAIPLGGAVELKHGNVIGEGWHAEFGGAHAEVAAIEAAGSAARGGDLVVTLEPCRHHGKTPPCVQAILGAGIRRVVFGAADVDPKARGGSLLLKTAGVAVEPGLMADDVRGQSAAFFHRFNGSPRPFVAVKLALSLDARIADHQRRSQWITGPDARDFVHWLRAGFDAVGVALGTVRADDPMLTSRGTVKPLVPPARVVFDTHAELADGTKLVKTARDVPTIVLAGPGVPDANKARLERAGVQLVAGDDLDAQLRALRARGVNSLLVEGGGVLAGRLIGAGLVDRLFLIMAPIILGRDGVNAFGELTGVKLEDVDRWKVAGRRTLGADQLTVLDRP